MACPFCSINTPAEVRLVLFLIQILNYMWIEAMFVNRLQLQGQCFMGAICLDTAWLTLRVTAVLASMFLNAPAMRLMYV